MDRNYKDECRSIKKKLTGNNMQDCIYLVDLLVEYGTDPCSSRICSYISRLIKKVLPKDERANWASICRACY